MIFSETPDLTIALIFVTHAMAQSFNQIGKAKAWLHPDFDADFHLAEGCNDWIELAKEFQAFGIIHDEIRVEDAVMVVSEAQYQFSEQVRVSTQSAWDIAKLPEKYAAYKEYRDRCSHSEVVGPQRVLSFDETRTIIEAGLTSDDIVRVDYEACGFGRDRTEDGIYRKQHGRVFYIKQKDWWARQKARITITTTERLPAAIFKSPRWSASDDGGNTVHHRFSVRHWDSDEVFRFQSVPVLRCEQASSQKLPGQNSARKIDLLVDTLLNDGGIDLIISDLVRHDKAINHATARGRNDMSDRNIATVLMFLSPTHFAMLNVIAQKCELLDGPDAIRMHYRDRHCQVV